MTVRLLCGIEVQLNSNGKIVKVHGGRQHSYTDGVICAKFHATASEFIILTGLLCLYVV